MSEGKKTGNLIIISSPSGGGKDSVINALLGIFPDSIRLVTTTSRPPRPKNKEGVDYYFISETEFKNKIANNEFVEFNVYSGHYYGVKKANLEKSLNEHQLVFTQVEVNGKHNIDKAGMPNLSIFLLPESLETLRKRIEKRGGLTNLDIEERLRVAQQEIDASRDYDYQIVNKEGQIRETIDKIAKIIQNKLEITKIVDKHKEKR